jgi:hypothetical protein
VSLPAHTLKTCTHTRTHVCVCTSHRAQCGHTMPAATRSLRGHTVTAATRSLPALAPSSMRGGRSTSVSRRNLQTENKFDPRCSSGSVRQCPACCLVCCSTGRATGVCAPGVESNPKPPNPRSHNKTDPHSSRLSHVPCNIPHCSTKSVSANLTISGMHTGVQRFVRRSEGVSEGSRRHRFVECRAVGALADDSRACF